MEKIEIEIVEKTETKVVLKNKNGDEFEFNPNSKNGESLFDFLFH
jgi:hypothetical protein